MGGIWNWEGKNEAFTFNSICFLNVKKISHNEQAFVYYSYNLKNLKYSWKM